MPTRAVVALLLLSLATLGAAPGGSTSSSSGPPDGLVFVAAGDSYSSGEGIPGTGHCAHSDLAYGPQVRDGLGDKVSTFSFVACTGHLAEDLFNPRPEESDTSLWDWAELPGVGEADLVTLSFGGNDIGFADVLHDCLPFSDSWQEAARGGILRGLPGAVFGDLGQGCETTDEDLAERIDALVDAGPDDDCEAGRHTSRHERGPEPWACSLLISGEPYEQGQVRGSLAHFYRHIAEKHLTTRGHLLVIGYPSLFAPVSEWSLLESISCSGITRGDAARLSDANEDLNTAIDAAVDLANQQMGHTRVHFVPTYGEYRDGQHDLCGSKADWINGFTMSKGTGQWPPYSGSFHPNRDGHAETARLVGAQVDSIDWSVDFSQLPTAVASSTTSLLIDTSSSMEEPTGDGSGTKLDAAKRAASDVLTVIEAQSAGAGSSGAHTTGLVEFSTDAFTVTAPTSDVATVRSSVQGLYPRAETNIGAGLSSAIDQLEGTKGTDGNKSVVLLSDGQTNQGPPAGQVLSEIVPRATASGIKVFTVGFGDANAGTIDEALLREIADATGGEYSFAETTISLQRSFMHARAATLGDVLVSAVGQVAQGQIAAAGSFAVAEALGELEVALAWPGSDLDVVLTDPRGRPVDDEYDGARIVRTNPEVVIVAEPLEGDWQLAVQGIDVPDVAEDYAVVASTRGVAPPKPAASSHLLLAGMGVLVLLVGTGLPVVLVTRRRSISTGCSCGTCGSAVAPDLRRCPACGGPTVAFLIMRVVGGMEDGRTLHVGVGDVIGRGDDVQHQLADDAVSRHHAQVSWQEGDWVILDLESTSGTLRNQEPIFQARLGHGDVLTLGDTTLVVEEPQPEPMQGAAP